MLRIDHKMFPISENTCCWLYGIVGCFQVGLAALRIEGVDGFS